MSISYLLSLPKKLPEIMSCLLLGLLFLYLALTSLVTTYSPSINFDDGWIGAMNFLPFSKYVAGHDYLFTYGPLYFLNVCVNTQPNQLLAQSFYVFLHICIGWVLFLYYRKFPPLQFSLFAAALLVSQFVDHNDFRTPSGHDYIPIVIVIIFLSVPLISGTKESIFSSTIAGIYAGILTFIKFDLLIELVVTICVYFLLVRPFKINYPKRAYLSFFAVWFGCILLLIMLAFKNPANWLNWIFANLTYVLFYIEVTYVAPAPACFFVFAIASILVLSLVILRSLKVQNILGHVSLSLLPSVALVFKHGFILPEAWHIISFYKYILVVIAYLLVFCKRKSDMLLLIIPFTCLSLLVFALDYLSGKVWCQTNNPSRLNSLKLSKSFLPDNANEKTFDSVPYNIMWCLANNLHYKPNPLIILYNASAAQNAKETAQYFLSPEAADYLFCEHLIYFRKHMFIETPLAWSSILSGYQIQNYDPQKYLLLLKKNTHPVLPRLSIENQFNCISNQWYSVAQCKNPLYLSFNFKLNTMGKIARLFSSLPAISINLKYIDGHMQNYKLVSRTAENGILLNYLPEDMPALKLLFENKAEQEIIQFELVGPGLQYYQSPISAKLLKDSARIIEFVPGTFNTSVHLGINKGLFLIPKTFMYSPSEDLTTTFDAIPTFKKAKDVLIGVTMVVLEKDLLIPPKSLFIQIDNGKLLKTACGVKLLEQGGNAVSTEAITAGFMTAIDIQNMKPGLHEINAVAQSRKDGNWYKIPSVGRFVTE